LDDMVPGGDHDQANYPLWKSIFKYCIVDVVNNECLRRLWHAGISKKLEDDRAVFNLD